MTRRLYFCEPGWEGVLLDELGRGFPDSQHRLLMPAWVESRLSPADDAIIFADIVASLGRDLGHVRRDPGHDATVP